MKQVQLKVVKLEGGGELNYKNELQTIFRSPEDRKQGANVEEMRRSIRVLDALENASDVLVLEDADYDYFKGRVNSARFGIVLPEIVKFIEEMTGV